MGSGEMPTLRGLLDVALALQGESRPEVVLRTVLEAARSSAAHGRRTAAALRQQAVGGPFRGGGGGPRRSTYGYAMDMNHYQQAALRTAAPKEKYNELFHLLLGLVGETGEIAEKAKKIVRDKDSDFSQWDIEDLKKELGDTLWYVAVIADYFDVPLEDVAQLNIAKLADRQKRAMLSGSGDNR